MGVNNTAMYNAIIKKRNIMEIYVEMPYLEITSLIKKLEFIRDNEHTNQCFVNTFEKDKEIISLFIQRTGNAKSD